MADRQRRGLYYNCDEKYAPSHRCKEHKLFQIDMTTQDLIKDINIVETPELQFEDTNTQIQADIEPPFSHEEPLISLHALSGISTPQNLKLTGYIKHQNVIVLVDSGSAHKFIHKRVVKETHCFVHAVPNFQIMITNGGMMKCGGRCENVKLHMGDYHLKTHLFSIDMGGCDIILWA
jgi:hypothetical protein